MIRALDAYGAFLGEGPAVVAGDLNNHVLWDTFTLGFRLLHAVVSSIEA